MYTSSPKHSVDEMDISKNYESVKQCRSVTKEKRRNKNEFQKFDSFGV